MTPRRKKPQKRRKLVKTRANTKTKAKTKIKIKIKERKAADKRVEKIVLPKTKIRVFGIGGGGNSIVADIAPQIKRADFIAVNTDLQALKKSAKQCKTFLFGEVFTHNLGTGMNPRLGELAAQKEKERIQKLFQGVDLSILIASLGGGTGSGSLPIFAEAGKIAGSVVLGIFTLPFKFEGEKKLLIAKKSLEKAESYLNGLILISNERIFRLIDKETPLQEALSRINEILTQSLSSLINVFCLPGFINIDFSDLKTILKGKEKLAYLHSIETEGDERVEKMIPQIFQNTLYEYDIKKPKRILFNIAGGRDLKISEVERISRAIYERNPQAKIIFGLCQLPGTERKIKVTILALGSKEQEKAKKKKVISRPKMKEMSQKKKVIKAVRAKSKVKEKKKALSAQKPKIKVIPKPKIKEEKIAQPQPEIKKEKESEREEKKEEAKLMAESKKPKRRSTLRRNALDLKKEAKRIEKEILAQEAKWDFPAFLRRKNEKISLPFYLRNKSKQEGSIS